MNKIGRTKPDVTARERLDLMVEACIHLMVSIALLIPIAAGLALSGALLYAAYWCFSLMFLHKVLWRDYMKNQDYILVHKYDDNNNVIIAPRLPSVPHIKLLWMFRWGDGGIFKIIDGMLISIVRFELKLMNIIANAFLVCETILALTWVACCARVLLSSF